MSEEGGIPTAERAGRLSRLRRHPDSAPFTVAFLAVVASRVAYHAIGVRWDGALMRHAWQLLDLRLLQEDLFRSVWYLHMQPPLFNLFIGIILKVSPFSDSATVAWVWQGLGLILCALVYDIARHLRFRPWSAAALTVLIVAGPDVVLYERWFEYEMPTMVLLCGTVSGFLRWSSTGRTRALVACTGCAAAAVLTRSLLHPVWLVGVVAVALLARPRDRSLDVRRVAAAAIVPLLLVGGVMVKNQILFGRSELSSWVGWNLHRIALTHVPQDQRPAMVETGELAQISAMYINLPLEYYDNVLGPCDPQRPGVRALSERTKSPDPLYPDAISDNNLNHECYLRIYDAYQDDSIRFIRTHKRAYVRNVVAAAHLWALPTSDYVFLRGNVDQLGDIEALYRKVVMLALPIDPVIDHPSVESQMKCIEFPNMQKACAIPGGYYRISLTVVGGTLATMLLAVRGAWRWRRRGERQQAVWLLLAGTIGWVTFASIALEIGENHRFRSIVEPLTILVVAVVVRGLATRVKRRFS